MPMDDYRAEHEMCERAIDAYRKRQSRMFLTCAINLMATDYKLEEVAAILREMADQIEDYG